jgi:tetratricopeptide (TPR) repeat protein
LRIPKIVWKLEMMTTRAFAIRWILVGCGSVLLVAGFVLNRKREAPPLPAISRYESLPKIFNEVLRQTHDEFLSEGRSPELLRKLARLYQANRLFREARACYRMLAAIPPGLNAHDHYFLADLAQTENDLGAAEVELRTVLMAEPNYVPARLVLAETLFKSGRESDAEKEYAAILPIEANHPQALLGLARVELQGQREDAAVAHLEQLMATHPESTSGAALFAKVLERRGKTGRAIAMTIWSQQKPEPVPADPWMSELFADVYDLQRISLRFEDYFRTGQIEEATTLLRRIEELDSQNPIVPLLKGWSAVQSHREEEAVSFFRLALASGGDPEKICPYLVQCLLALGKVAEAATLMAEYHAKMPDSTPVAKAYADVALRRGDGILARGLLEKILEREPYLYAQNMDLAQIFWTAGERAKAVPYLQKAALAHRPEVAAQALLGEYFLEQGDPASAIPPLEVAMARAQPSTPARARLEEMLHSAYLLAGNGEVEKGQLIEAAQHYDQASGLAPADLSGYAGAASARVQLKQFGRAAEALEKMLSLQPDNPTIYLSLGDVIYQDGRATEAMGYWRKALQYTAAGDTQLRTALDDRISGRITAEIFR